MTRDVKVGLLLGLAFIFMIAFVINGLPSFRGDSNELTKIMVDFPNKQPGIGAKEREVINQTESIENQSFKVEHTPIDEPDIRFKTTLPQPPPSVESKNPSSLQESDVVKPALPKIYAVSEGDNLALIAKKFYGDEEGNKRANIMKIFEANRNLLNTADEIQVGQKLIIPPLQDSSADKKQGQSVFSTEIFKKVVSIGREHLSSDKASGAEQSKLYTVREGDSLWRIAAEQLGDGSRYNELAKLNADILSDENSLTVGMSLKIPAK